jgi:hypothetical protein
MRRLTVREVHSVKVAELGLDPSSLDLTSTEAIAAALRRAASFLCPCSATTLVRGVVRPLRDLVADLDVSKELVEQTLEAMIAHGDVLEERDIADDQSTQTSTLLYAAPASFVRRRSGAVILLGVSSDQVSALPNEMEQRIEHVGHVRRLKPAPGEDLRSELRELGLIELSYDAWLRSPATETAASHAARARQSLDSAYPSRDIPGLLLLDPMRPVCYYRGRWVEPKSHTGCYVGRRSQAYGADLWCYVQVRDGQPEQMIDFPRAGSRWRGCDEAWRLQLAIDAQRNEPQRFRIRTGPGESTTLELFSPVPAWARRRWDAIGEPLVSSGGCLFAYRFAQIEIEEEVRFARESLWLEELGATAPLL